MKLHQTFFIVRLIKAVGWQYALVVTACIVLLNIFFGALFRPPRAADSKVKVKMLFGISRINPGAGFLRIFTVAFNRLF